MSTSSPRQMLRTLAASATIGTDRTGGKTTPEKLLTEAAALGLRARAGWRPRTVQARVLLCPPDPRPVATTAAMGTLRRVLAEPDAALIEEWAELASAAGARVADAMVPAVLDWWSRQPRKSVAVFAVLGKRGEWLAGLNADWYKPVTTADIPANADEIWNTGSGPERAALLAAVRRHDAARGLALVESTWSADGADERRRFVDQLANGLSMSDEPFLESALEDRSKQVRASAARLLSRLAESGFAQRMLERSLSLLGVKRGGELLARRAKVWVEPPLEFDSAWARDGIEENAPEKVGKRAWWLRQIVGSTHPSALAARLQLSPGDLLKGIRGQDYADDVLCGLNQSAAEARDAAWCEALVTDDDATRVGPLSVHDRLPLWTPLSPETRERLLGEVAAQSALARTTRWAFLTLAQHAWSSDFSRRTMESLGGKAPVKAADIFTAGAPLEVVSRHIHTSACDLFEAAMVPLFGDGIPPVVRKLVDRVRLRADMHKEFAS